MADIHLEVTDNSGQVNNKTVSLAAFKKCRSSVPPTWYKNAKSVRYWSGFGKAGEKINPGDNWVKLK